MNTKILSVFLFIALSVIMVNAVDIVSISKGPVLTQSAIQSYFDISGLSNSNIVMSNQVIRLDDGNNNYMALALNPSSLNQALAQGTIQRVNATLAIDPNFNFQIKTYTFPSITLTATNGTVTDTKTVALTFQKTFCKYGENGTALSFSQVDIRNENGDDTEWKPLDHIKVTIKVDNNGNNKISKVYAEIGLIDSNGKNIINTVENLDNKKISLGSINDGSDKSATFEFDVPADFKEETYDFVVKVYSGSESQLNPCVSSSSDLSDKYFESIDGIRETTRTKQVILTNIQVSPSPAQCNDKVQVSAEVFNVGDEDYENQIKVNIYNKELGLNQDQVIREDLNQGDSQLVNFEFDVPQNTKEKSYLLQFKTYYDYKSSSDSYNIQSEKTFTETLQVQGGCTPVVIASALKITAELDPQTPEATAGKELIIDAALKNTGTDSSTWTLSTVGNSAWSSLVSIEPQTLSLAAGASKNIIIKLNLDSAAEGDKEFTIRAISGDKTVEQKVALSIVKPSASGNAFVQHIRANWFIYVIILVNIILIIAIISVIRRMIGSPSREYQ